MEAPESSLKFDLLAEDGRARLGRVTTYHASFETPIFMPVGTAATVKSMTSDDLKAIGTKIILSNAYHLYLRPGHELIEEQGGLHKFMAWDGATLTDSGGFQVMSLSGLNKRSEEGVEFASHIDGSKHMISPEKSMEIQRALGSDIVMVFDECLAYESSKEDVAASKDRTTRWAKRCQAVDLKSHQSLFAIQQGGMHEDLRREHAEELTELNFPGYAIGGLSVGEPLEVLWEMTRIAAPMLPKNKPRYLMGVGRPQDLIEAVAAGVDMFDCVMPTRNARNGSVFTWSRKINIRNAKYSKDNSPLDPDCSCMVCQKFTRAYLRHLHNAGEMLGGHLCTYHNLYFYLDLIRKVRESIREKRFDDFRQAFYKKFHCP